MAQAQENSGNWIWWTLGGVALLGLGVGSYFFFSKKGDGGKSKTNEDDKKPVTNTVVQEKVVYRDRPASTTTTTTTETATPEAQTNFNNKEQGNAFRRWVRAKDESYAKEIDLSATGPFDNATIRKAYAKYGSDFQKTNSEVLTKRFSSSVPGEGWTKIDDNFGIAERYYESGDANNGARISFDRNGRVYIQGRKNGTWGSKWKAGGWYLRGSQPVSSDILIFINGKEYKPYSSELFNMKKDLVWAIWKDGGLWSGTAFTAFSDFTPSGNDMDIFSMNGGEIILGGGSTSSVQDSLL